MRCSKSPYVRYNRRMRAAVIASLLVSCSTVTVIVDAADGTSDGASPCNGQPVYGRCFNEGATGCGCPAQCSDYRVACKPITRTCRNGVWDCNNCRACDLDLRTHPPASVYDSLCAHCQGGSVTRCDGTRVNVVECYCACGIYACWHCTDFAGQT